MKNQQGKTYISQVQTDCFCQVNILDRQTNRNFNQIESSYRKNNKALGKLTNQYTHYKYYIHTIHSIKLMRFCWCTLLWVYVCQTLKCLATYFNSHDQWQCVPFSSISHPQLITFQSSTWKPLGQINYRPFKVPPPFIQMASVT